jgi:sugar lactone lactonase YvrE
VIWHGEALAVPVRRHGFPQRSKRIRPCGIFAIPDLPCTVFGREGMSGSDGPAPGEVIVDFRGTVVGCCVVMAVTSLGVLAGDLPARAQSAATAAASAPDLAYIPVPGLFQAPPGDTLGEMQGVATNSKGDVFAFFRGPRTRLWEFDPHGRFVKEIGKGFYGFMFAHSVRVDAHDNIWTVDEGTNVITKFDPSGTKVLMVLGHRPDPGLGPVASAQSADTQDSKYTFCRPTDVAFDSHDNIFVSDGYCNNRVVKYDKYGHFLAQVGSKKKGSGVGEFNLPHAIAVDAKGNVYVADRTNNRYVVLDNDLKWKTTYTNVGTAWSDCISQGAHQYLFVSNSNPNGNRPGTWARTGQIYKMELDGTVLGKFGHAGKLAPGFQVVHMMDCRDPDRIIVGEIESWRMQEFVLKGSPAARQMLKTEGK